MVLKYKYMHAFDNYKTMKIIRGMYRPGEVSVRRACCERATQPYSLGRGGTIYPGSRPAGQNQDKDSLLVKRRNDNHSPGPVIRELVPSCHQRSELSNTILCIFSGWDQRIGEGIPIPDSLRGEATFINICIGNGSLKAIECWFQQRLVLGIRSSVVTMALPVRPLYSNISLLSFLFLLEGFSF